MITKKTIIFSIDRHEGINSSIIRKKITTIYFIGIPVYRDIITLDDEMMEKIKESYSIKSK